MVSCLMGDSTALASAIVRCCHKSRKDHKLDEWRELCAWIESLPYSELITGPDLSRTPICDEIIEEAKERVKMDTYAVTPRSDIYGSDA